MDKKELKKVIKFLKVFMNMSYKEQLKCITRLEKQLKEENNEKC